ncbi:conjugal transfer protein TraH [Rickettsiaceae bacterium]|nr:conjugal transfer protein TraH [Rickettsiaceae bacterium]
MSHLQVSNNTKKVMSMVRRKAILPLKVAAILFGIICSTSISAKGFGLKDVYENLHTNVTKPGSYQDAAAGYYSGGSMSIRTKSTAINPFSMSLPSITTGCNGIDAFTGSFSMISGGQLIAIAENIGSNAVVYGFHLGMKTYAPQIENTLKDFRNLQMQLNQFGIGHCKVAQAGFAAALPQNSAMYEKVCEEMSGGSGYDLGDQRKKCKKHQDQQKEVEKAQTANADLLLDNFNLFKKAADKSGLPTDLRDSLMSMVGTIVVKDRVTIPYPALVTDKQSFDTHLNGGAAASSYTCQDGAECLVVKLSSNIEIQPDNSYAGIAKRKLDEIKIKIRSQESELSSSDIGFIDSIGNNFPIFDHITLEVSTGISIINSSSQLIAKYMFLSHLTSITNDIKRSVAALRKSQINETHLKDYEKSLDKVLAFANNQWDALQKEEDRINARAKEIERHYVAKGRG